MKMTINLRKVLFFLLTLCLIGSAYAARYRLEGGRGRLHERRLREGDRAMMRES